MCFLSLFALASIAGCKSRDTGVSEPGKAAATGADPAPVKASQPDPDVSPVTELVEGPPPPASPPACPDWSTFEGAPPPNGDEAWCERNGQRHGPAVKWGARGTITQLDWYADGVPHGPTTTWLADGMPVASGQNKEGLPDGPWTTYMDGKRAIVGEMVRGKQHGGFTQWAGTGRKQAVGQYRYGEPCGVFRCWDWETGKPTECVPLKGRCPLTDTGGQCPPCDSITERWDAGPPGGVPIGGYPDGGAAPPPPQPSGGP
jgi:hypothetical protein